ncbi:MAG: SDR family oxidoreductase [Caulobacteraceae bacterium]
MSRAGLAAAAEQLGAPEVIIHTAGGASVGASLADPAGDQERTVGSLVETLDFLRRDCPAARLVYPSSAAVYGAGHAGPIAEDAPLAPISPYGEHKRPGGGPDRGGGGRVRARRDDHPLLLGLRTGPAQAALWDLAGRLAARPARVELSGTGEETRISCSSTTPSP